MKNLKTFIISILFISILITSVFLSACHDDDDQDWIKIYTCDSLNLKNDNCSAIVRSVENIMTICDENTSPIFEEQRYGPDYYIIEKLKEYDEEFFEEKSLIVLFRFRASSGHFFYVKDFEFIDNSINITLARDIPKEPVGYPDDVITCVYFLEFPKEKVKDITQVNVQEIINKE